MKTGSQRLFYEKGETSASPCWRGRSKTNDWKPVISQPLAAQQRLISGAKEPQA